VKKYKVELISENLRKVKKSFSKFDDFMAKCTDAIVAMQETDELFLIKMNNSTGVVYKTEKSKWEMVSIPLVKRRFRKNEQMLTRINKLVKLGE